MSQLYENLLKATDNLTDINFSKYGTITKLDNNLANVKEEGNDLEHTNVPLINGTSFELGDKVILFFIENSLYNPIVIGKVGGVNAAMFTSDLIERSALENIDVEANSNQHEINLKINELIGGSIDLSEYMKKQDYTNDLANQTDTSQFLQALDNTIQAITGRGDL